MRIPDRRIWLAGILVVAYAFVAVGGSTAGRTGAAFAIVGGLLGIVGVAVLLWSPPQPLGSSWSHIPGVIGILLVLVLLILIGRAWPFGIQALLVSGPMAILFLPSSRGDAHRMWLVAVAVVAVPIVLIPVASTGLAEQPDVQMAHRAAGDAFREGLNPYVAVSVEDTSPYASDGAMIGYPYPPATLVPYGVGAMFGAGAWITVMCLIATSAWLAISLIRSRYVMGGLSAAAMHVALPSSIFLAFIGSTEPLSVSYFLISLISYRTRPVLSAIFFGIAVASKQYLAFMLVVLLLTQIQGRVRYAAIATVAAVLTYLPFVLLDVEALWNGVLGVHVDRWVIRPESLSIAAFGVFLGSPIILSVVLALILLLGRRVRDMGSLYLMGAASMAVITILSPQSFANYWYIVVAFMLLAITERWRVLGDEKVPGADPPYSAVTRTTPLA